MKIKDIIKNKPNKRNPVAKNMGINRSATHTDRKKALKDNPRKAEKHKGRVYESMTVLFEERKVWTKEEIRNKLATDDRWLVRALMAIYKHQTDDEKNSLNTKHYNSVGFNGIDAEFLSSAAQWYQRTGRLSSKQLVHVRRKMMKYSGQLARVANGVNHASSEA